MVEKSLEVEWIEHVMDEYKLCEWKPIRLGGLGEVGNLQELQRNAEMAKVMRIFRDAGLTAREGLNVAGQNVLVQLSLPTAGFSPSLPRGSRLVWTLLGLGEIVAPGMEAVFRAQRSRFLPLLGKWEDDEERRQAHSMSLANLCLRLLVRHAHIAVVEMRRNLRLRTLTVVLEPASLGLMAPKTGELFTDKKNVPFWFSPGYAFRTGFAKGGFSNDALAAQTAAATAQQTKRLFESMQRGAGTYFADAGLMDAVCAVLQRQLSSAAGGLAAGYSPEPRSRPVTLYLHGRAGIGKSSFVRSFGPALRALLQAEYDESLRVDVVRVPLNALSVHNLRRILYVKGLSDWSVERVLEQTLAKGGLALLHLEEMPEDPALQTDLVDALSGMLNELFKLYPAAKPLVWCVYTSNYEPVGRLAEACDAVVQMQPPSLEVERAWCQQALLATVQGQLASDPDRCQPPPLLEVRFESSPPACPDMRKMQTWRLCVGYAVAHLWAVAWESTERNDSDGKGSKKPSHVVYSHENERTVVIRVDSASKDHVMRLRSDDGFFFYPEHISPDLPLDSAEERFGLAKHLVQSVSTVVHMALVSFVRPAVVVAHGDPQHRANVVAAVRQILDRRCVGAVHAVQLSALQEEDRMAIFGDPEDPIMGGIFRFIDNVTNPLYQKPHDAVFVHAVANDYGQFLLRELIEDDDSRTHRTSIRKLRTVFLLDIPAEVSLSPQLISRAHIII